MRRFPLMILSVAADLSILEAYYSPYPLDLHVFTRSSRGFDSDVELVYVGLQIKLANGVKRAVKTELDHCEVHVKLELDRN